MIETPYRTDRSKINKDVTRSYQRSALIAQLITFLALRFRLPQFFTEASNWLLSDNGDGIKNYFTMAWQVRYGQDPFNFMGMNYPFGEHVFYTDGHPLLTWLFQLLSPIFPSIADHTTSILNIILLISFPIAAGFITMILSELGTRRAVAISGGVIVALLSPQLFRLGGHYALAWAFFIPAMIWYALRLDDWKHLQNGWSLFLIVMIAWLTHGYLGAMCTGFFFLIVLIRTLKDRNWRTLMPAVGAILPPILFLIVLALTDQHTLRTDNPAGLMLYFGEADDVFIPNAGPIKDFIDSIRPIGQKWEALAYVGIPTALCSLYLLYLFIRRRHWNITLTPIWIASLAMLAFAFGFPFKFFPELAEAFPMFKQFRGTGRFTWPFFYVSVTFAIAWIDRYSKDSASPVWRLGLPVLYLSFLGFEAYTHFLNATGYLGVPNSLKVNVTDHPPKADAILPLPFFHHGSESYDVPRDDAAMRQAMVYSYQTGIPLMAANLTRVSIPESRSIIQLMGKPWYDKPLLTELEGAKLMLYIAGQPRPEEQWIIDAAGISSEIGQFRIIRPGLLADPSGFARPQPKTDMNDQLISTFPGNQLYRSFDETPSDTSLHGSGSFHGFKKGRNTLLEILPGEFRSSEELQLAIWFYENEKDALNLYFRLLIEEYGSDGEMTRLLEYFPERNIDFLNGWSLTRASIPAYDPNKSYVICTEGKSNSKARLHADLLGIWPAGDTLFLPLNIHGVEMTYFNGDLIPVE